MPSKIIFMGTGGDSFVVGKQIRASGGVIIQDGEIQLHVDPGPGALVRAAMYDVNLRATTAVLVSSNDIINSGDVNSVVDAMTYGGLDKKGVLIAAGSVINGTEKQHPIISNFYKDCLEKFMVLNHGQKIAIEDVEIQATPAFNEDNTSIGFKIFTTESVIGYTANTKYSKELIETFKGIDILIINVLFPGSEKVEHRLNTEDAVKLIKGINPQLAIIKNFGAKMVKLDLIGEGREIQRLTGVQTIVAKDGMSFTPNSYSARSKQMRLNIFPAPESPKATASFSTDAGEMPAAEIQEPIAEFEPENQEK